MARSLRARAELCSGRACRAGGVGFSVRSRLTVMAVAVVALFAVSAACSGCLWIAIPSLAYEGYKYESGGGHNAQTKQQHQSSQTPANDDVE
jgi:hypothetical protein